MGVLQSTRFWLVSTLEMILSFVVDVFDSNKHRLEMILLLRKCHCKWDELGMPKYCTEAHDWAQE